MKSCEQPTHCTCIEPWEFPIGFDSFCGTCGRPIRGRRRAHKAGLKVEPRPRPAEWAASHRESVAEAVNRDDRSLTARAAIAIGAAIGNGFVLAYHISRFFCGGRR